MTSTETRLIDRIDALLEARGMTGRALETAAELGVGTLSKMRSKNVSIGSNTLPRIAAALDVTVGELMGEVPPPPAAPAEWQCPHNLITPSPLNPRKHFDADALQELAESLAVEGMLQPILVRLSPENDGTDFHIIAGERRWRAMALLIEAGRLPADAPVPYKLVNPCDDRRHLELAVTENVARRDMTPWEEAQAFAALVNAGASTQEIADTVGMNRRTVQKRLKLVDGLHPDVARLVSDGQVSVEMANVLASACPMGKQPDALNEAHVNGWTTDTLRRRLLLGRPKVAVARFDLALYDGEYITADDGERYFADIDQAWRLQREAVKGMAAELDAAGRAWVKVVEDHVSGAYRYAQQPDDPAAGAIVWLDKHDMSVDICDHLVEWQPAGGRAAPSDKPAAPVEPYTKSHLMHARRRKTLAMQDALLKSGDTALATRLVCLGLLGGEAVKIRPEPTHSDDRERSNNCAAVLGGFVENLSGCFDKVEYCSSTAIAGEWRLIQGKEHRVLDALLQMHDEDLDRLFLALVGLRIGTWNDYTPDLGDSGAACTIADALGLFGNEDSHGPGLVVRSEDCKGVRKDVLVDLCRNRGIDADPDDKVSDLMASLAGGPPLPTMRFGGKLLLEAQLNAARKPAQMDIEETANAVRPGAPPRAGGVGGVV